jgi:uncharacterized membrane protein
MFTSRQLHWVTLMFLFTSRQLHWVTLIFLFTSRQLNVIVTQCSCLDVNRNISVTQCSCLDVNRNISGFCYQMLFNIAYQTYSFHGNNVTHDKMSHKLIASKEIMLPMIKCHTNL